MKLIGFFLEILVIFGIIYVIGYILGYRGAALKTWAKNKTTSVGTFFVGILVVFLLGGLVYAGYQSGGIWGLIIMSVLIAFVAFITWLLVGIVNKWK